MAILYNLIATLLAILFIAFMYTLLKKSQSERMKNESVLKTKREKFKDESVFLCNSFDNLGTENVNGQKKILLQLYGESTKDILRPGMKLNIINKLYEIHEVYGADIEKGEDPALPTEFANPNVPDIAILFLVDDFDFNLFQAGLDKEIILPLHIEK